MNDKQKLDLMFSLFLLMSFMAYYLVYMLENYECPSPDYERINESCNMRFQKNITNGVNGLYQNGKYYCVWTEGRTREEIAGTTFHELAHYFNYVEAEHFKEDFE